MGVIMCFDAPPSGEFHNVLRLSKIAAILVIINAIKVRRITRPINNQLIS